MKLISLHLNHLMRTHDCVVVPGIGAFLALERGARFDAETLTVYPAVREICFNASITHNDGVLASSVSRREGLDYSGAVSAIEEEAAQMKQALLQGSVQIGNLGTLSSTSEGNLQFSPASAEDEERLLGFAPVSLRSHKEEPQEETIEEEPDYLIRKSGYWYIPIPKTATKVAASLLLLAAVAISFLLPQSTGKTLPDKASVVPVVRVEKPVKEAEPEATAEEVAPAEPQEVLPEAKAFLIVATFKSEAQAQRFIESNKESSLELVAGGSVFRVSAAKAETSEELRTVLNSRDMQSRFPEAWIWVAP